MLYNNNNKTHLKTTQSTWAVYKSVTLNLVMQSWLKVKNSAISFFIIFFFFFVYHPLVYNKSGDRKKGLENNTMILLKCKDPIDLVVDVLFSISREIIHSCHMKQ